MRYALYLISATASYLRKFLSNQIDILLLVSLKVWFVTTASLYLDFWIAAKHYTLAIVVHIVVTSFFFLSFTSV